jgi:hypothetical protein
MNMQRKLNQRERMAYETVARLEAERDALQQLLNARDEEIARLSKPAEKHHGEPVALPERRELKLPPEGENTDTGSFERGWLRGWNACLDEIAKLGPLFTHPAPAVQQEPVAWCQPHWSGKYADYCWGSERPNSPCPELWKPLYAHADPGEVERLRTRLEEELNLHVGVELKHEKERDTLRAQLNELLTAIDRHREALKPLGLPLGDRLEEAVLSASAEPSSPKCSTCHDQGEVFVRKGDVHYGMQTEPEPIMAACPECEGPSAPVERDERAEFESELRKKGRPLTRADYDPEAYGNAFDDGAWLGWQARAALESKPSDLEVAGYEGSAGLYYSKQAAVANGEQRIEPVYRVKK